MQIEDNLKCNASIFFLPNLQISCSCLIKKKTLINYDKNIEHDIKLDLPQCCQVIGCRTASWVELHLSELWLVPL